MTKQRQVVGDTVLLASSGHSPMSPDRRGEVVDILGGSGDTTYVVRWPDGRLSCLPQTVVRPARGPDSSSSGGSSGALSR
jgi:uncharacterized protein DUF1918